MTGLIVKATKSIPAKYKHEINVKKFEQIAWEKGTQVTNGKTWKVFRADDIIGACNGVETPYVIIKMSANTIHGHPITFSEFKKYTK